MKVEVNFEFIDELWHYLYDVKFTWKYYDPDNVWEIAEPLLEILNKFAVQDTKWMKLKRLLKEEFHKDIPFRWVQWNMKKIEREVRK